VLQSINFVVIAVVEGVDGENLYWVRCLNDERQIVTGDMYYSLAAARRFLSEEYGVEGVAWKTL